MPTTDMAALDHSCAAFVAAAGLAPDVRVRTVIEHGAIESVLARHVREHDVELVVTGNRGTSGVMGVLLGSTAVKCLDWLPCDVLRVREPEPSVPGRRPARTGKADESAACLPG